MALGSKLGSSWRVGLGLGSEWLGGGRSRSMASLSTSAVSMKKSDKSPTDHLTPDDPKTHTGQEFDKDDYRMVRFINRPKQINTRFAIDLIDEVPPKEEKSSVVSCDGGGGPTGHPKVYINLDQPGNHCCGYCGLRFYKSDHHH